MPGAIRSAQSAIGGSARVLVAGSCATALIIRRDVPTFLWLAGAIGNAALSKILKRLINEARPEGARTADPGMPSSHSMSLFFLATFVALAVQSWCPGSSMLAAWHRPRLEAILLVAYATFASSWRIGAGYHTADQVAVGSCLGALSGFIWQRICRCFLWEYLAHLFPTGKAPIGPTVALLVCGAVVVGSVERRIKRWFALVKQLRG